MAATKFCRNVDRRKEPIQP
jgi:Xanthosine triphosphate pyrophosphatase